MKRLTGLYIKLLNKKCNFAAKKEMNKIIERNQILEQVRQTISNSRDKESSVDHDRFFKEGEAAKAYGLKTADVNKIAKASFDQVKNYPKQIILDLCEEFWKSGYLEEAVIACTWAESLHKAYEFADFSIFERWLSNYVTNWAACDTLCNHTIGSFVMMYPDSIVKLKEWAQSSNRWMRRGAAVSLIIPARKGLFLNDILEIADTLLLDKDDLVQKGYGWMLKAASMSETFVKGNDEIKKEHLAAVFNYVMKIKAVMPRTALRYAIEKMPADRKARAMEK